MGFALRLDQTSSRLGDCVVLQRSVLFLIFGCTRGLPPSTRGFCHDFGDLLMAAGMMKAAGDRGRG